MIPAASTQQPPAAERGAQYRRALWLPHNHFWNGRSHHQIRYVILHAFAWPGANPSAEEVARLYQKSHEKRGPHYIVDRAGNVAQCVREQDAAWSNGVISAGAADWWGQRGNPNLETLSIEVVKMHGDHSDAVGPAQMQAVFLLVAYLIRKYEIPARWADAVGGVTGHFSIDPVHFKYCPGPFPWVELFHSLVAPGDYPGSGLVYADRAGVIPADGVVNGTGAGYFAPVRPTVDAPASGAVPVPTGGAGGGTGSGEPAPSVSERAHDALQEAPGFYGIVRATDTAEQFAGLNVSTFSDVPNWLASNGVALLFRLLLILLGLGLIGALLWSLVRRNEWMGNAGGDLIPLALANVSATGNAGKGAPDEAS